MSFYCFWLLVIVLVIFNVHIYSRECGNSTFDDGDNSGDDADDESKNVDSNEDDNCIMIKFLFFADGPRCWTVSIPLITSQDTKASATHMLSVATCGWTCAPMKTWEQWPTRTNKCSKSCETVTMHQKRRESSINARGSWRQVYHPYLCFRSVT